MHHLIHFMSDSVAELRSRGIAFSFKPPARSHLIWVDTNWDWPFFLAQNLQGHLESSGTHILETIFIYILQIISKQFWIVFALIAQLNTSNWCSRLRWYFTCWIFCILVHLVDRFEDWLNMNFTRVLVYGFSCYKMTRDWKCCGFAKGGPFLSQRTQLMKLQHIQGQSPGTDNFRCALLGVLPLLTSKWML